MNKSYKLFTPLVILLMALCVVLCGIVFAADHKLFVAAAILTALIFLLVIMLLRGALRKSSDLLGDIAEGVRYAGTDSFIDTDLPTITVYDGEIVWYNDTCRDRVLEGREMRGELLSDLLPGLDISKSSGPAGENISLNGRSYTAFVTPGRRNGGDIALINLVDDTELKHYTAEYYQSQPSIALVLVDNYDEIMQDYKDVERAQLMGQIERIVEGYFNKNSGFVTRIERDRFMVVIQERGIRKMIDSKFNILDAVREIEVTGRLRPTLSIGLGREAADLADSESMASQALDMCLGRGGDQAAVRTQNGYDFYGGVSKGVEKRTKVKTRIIASALGELIQGASNVILMGHRFADLDALGAAVGMLAAARAMNKPSFICIDPQRNLVGQLIQTLREGGYSDQDFRAPAEALKAVNQNTVLIIADAHVPNILESEELYRACKNVVVIDHHRKLVGFIDNAVIFYHEPYASSASEMVTELIQYLPKRPSIGKLEAEALLSGITLDTKNFIMRTGVRTFEAAAWLRKMGADTIAVRSMFTSSIESYQQKAAIVAGAETFFHCAIAVADGQFEGMRIVASQAADDLLNISGISASFVIYYYDGLINVSARSMGALNVQVIMEQLGGGGHPTMAAAQFAEGTIDEIKTQVQGVIRRYYESLPPEQRPADFDRDFVSADTTPTDVASAAAELVEKTAAVKEIEEE